MQYTFIVLTDYSIKVVSKMTTHYYHFMTQYWDAYTPLRGGSRGGYVPSPQSLVMNDQNTLIEQSVTLIKQSQCTLVSVVYLWNYKWR